MKPRTLLLFCCLILALAISLCDGEKVRKKSTAKVQVKKVSGGKKGTTVAFLKSKGTTKKKKKKTTPKSSLTTTNKVQEMPMTVIEELAPDNESGTVCFDSCFKNPKMLDDAGKILDPNQYGKFTDFCGKTYLFGSKMITWEENWKTCCSIGMQPVIYETQDDINCIKTKLQSSADLVNKPYWTGGFKHAISGRWSWCTRDAPQPIHDDMTTDISVDITTPKPIEKDRVKPSELKACFLTTEFDSSSGAYLLGKLEFEKSYLACESVDKLTPDILPGSKCRAKCSKSCSKKVPAKLDDKQELELSKGQNSGRWVSMCGKYLLFSNKLATYEDARQTCCSMNANLLSIKSNAKRICMAQLVKDYPDTTGEYWTSGSDTGCDGNFRWCSVDRAFLKEEVRWAKSEPNLKKGDCVWTNTNMEEKNSLLYTDNCNAKKKFICEVRQTGITPEEIHKECVDLLNVTPAEVDTLKNIDQYTYKMKCYLQCMGDNLGLLINGTLQEGRLVQMMDSLNVNYDILFFMRCMDTCKEPKDKNDVCQNAFLIFKCLKEQAPKEFGLMINRNTQKEVNAPVEIRTPRLCEMDFSVICNPIGPFKAKLDSTGETPAGGKAIIGYDGNKWYKSEYAAQHSYQYAYQTCCNLGMHLPWANSYDEFKSLYDFMNGSSTDNFYAETLSAPEGEKWCGTLTRPLDPQMSNDEFKLLREKSILYTQKNSLPKYKLKTIATSAMEASVRVNHFFCQPYEEEN